MADERYCCTIDCPRSAEFAIYGESGFPDDHTDACVDHVGSLLGTPIDAPGDNRSWRVVLIDPEEG